MLTQNDCDANLRIPDGGFLVEVEHKVEECADGVTTDRGCDDVNHAGIMNEWFKRYLPMTVVPERSKLTVAMSDG